MRVPKYRRRVIHGKEYGSVRIDGKDHSLGEYNSPASKKKYDQLIKQHLNRKEKLKGSTGTTMSSLLADYLSHAAAYYKGGVDGSEFKNIALVAGLIREKFEMLDTLDFGPQHVKELRDFWIEEGVKTRQGINKRMGLVRRICKWGAEHEWIDGDKLIAIQAIAPLKAGKSTAREAKEVEAVPIELVEATCRYLTPVVRTMIWVQLYSGCRPGEVIRLTPGVINTQADIWEVVFDEWKMSWLGQDRAIFLGPKSQELLKPYMDREPDAYLFSPRESEEQRRAAREAQRLTPKNQGNRRGMAKTRAPSRTPGLQFTTQSYNRSITNANSRGKLPNWSPNQLRHLAATTAKEEQGLEASQAHLGHRHMDTTQIYTDRLRKTAIDYARQFG